MVTHFVFDELAELLAQMDPDKVLAFHTSEKAQNRLNNLLKKNKTSGGLSSEEEEEIKHFMLVEHIVSLAKVRALQLLAQSPA